MPSRSHGRCKVCRAITHINSRFGLCAVHMRQRNKRIAEERAETKARKARRLAAVLEEGPAMTEQAAPPDKPAQPGHKPRNLSPELEVRVLDAYTQTDESVKHISERFGIKDTYIYNVLGRAGIDWRRGNPESFEQWQANQQRKPAETVPPEVDKALENMLRLPTLPPRPEPVAPTPAVERRSEVPRSNRLLMFEVTVTGTYTVSAMDIMAAMQRVMADQPQLRITGIRELD